MTRNANAGAADSGAAQTTSSRNEGAQSNQGNSQFQDGLLDRAVEIERLATLEVIDYETSRTDAAKRLRVRAQVLDREVGKKRRELGLEAEDDAGQGRVVKIEDVLPWADAIEGDRVATGLAASLKKYVVLSDAAADVIALWILHTWLVDKFIVTPRLAVTSPTKGCGKTTVLRFLNQVGLSAQTCRQHFTPGAVSCD
jgi:hypothetical protein